MPTRRTTLETLAGGAVVGSLSGCVQIATKRTAEFNGTPAMLSAIQVDPQRLGNPFGAAVVVEAHKTIERFGVRKEIITNNWGLFYQDGDRIAGRTTAPDDEAVVTGRDDLHISTFATPSIRVAGQELNPVKDLTVTDIGTELLATVRNGTAWPGRNAQMLATSAVQKATGRKVLRAFRRTIDEHPEDAGEYEIVQSWTEEQQTPDWNGDTYSASYKVEAAGYDPDADDPWAGIIRFDKHNGDYVIIFGLSSPAYDIEDNDDFIVNVTYSGSPDVDGFAISHPTSDKFTREHLVRHLLKTNLRGIQTLVEEIVALADETKVLLQKAAENSQKEETDQVISDTLADVRRIEELNSGLQSDLDQISFRGTGATMPPEVERINNKAKRIQELAMQAQQRMANIRVDVDGDGTYDRTIEETLGEISNRANMARMWTTDRSIGLSSN